MKLLLVEWFDSHGSARGWASLDDCTPDLLTVQSVGWLLHDTDEVIVIVPHVCEPAESSRIARQGRGEMTIPKCAIHRQRELPSDLLLSAPDPERSNPA